MRTAFVTLLTALLVAAYVPSANAQASFSRTLTIGSYGEDVRALQKILNSDFYTLIQGNGPGSPGQETLYFGARTRDAVIRYQNKHADKILSTNGLSAGTGIVGPSTRATLIAMNDPTPVVPPPVRVAPPISAVPLSVTPATSPSPAPTITKTAYTNPNLKNLDQTLAAIDKAATKQGVSIADIEKIKEQVMKVIATTTDLRATFEKIVQSKSNQAVQDNSIVGKTLAIVKRAFDKIFMPEQAQAATGIPFGGAILLTFPCENGAWYIVVSPLPPTFVTSLAYMIGSQAFLSYNIPFTSWLLGEYEPFPCGCYIYPSCFYAEGLITPMVGSSPL